jgi:prepilin-type N-terminal cleavage/methylation domain-containing protein
MRRVIGKKIQSNSEGAFTLLELIIASALVGTISLAMYSIVEFSRYHVGNADVRARVQNSASYIADHMSRNLSQAIGSTVLPGEMPVDNSNIGGDRAIMYWIDRDSGTGDSKGQSDPMLMSFVSVLLVRILLIALIAFLTGTPQKSWVRTSNTGARLIPRGLPGLLRLRSIRSTCKLETV